eukprot:m51a1_g9370 hypothetical protein (355) ;mRNA; f:191371-193605
MAQLQLQAPQSPGGQSGQSYHHPDSPGTLAMPAPGAPAPAPVQQQVLSPRRVGGGGEPRRKNQEIQNALAEQIRLKAEAKKNEERRRREEELNDERNEQKEVETRAESPPKQKEQSRLKTGIRRGMEERDWEFMDQVFEDEFSKYQEHKKRLARKARAVEEEDEEFEEERDAMSRTKRKMQRSKGEEEKDAASASPSSSDVVAQEVERIRKQYEEMQQKLLAEMKEQRERLETQRSLAAESKFVYPESESHSHSEVSTPRSEEYTNQSDRSGKTPSSGKRGKSADVPAKKPATPVRQEKAASDKAESEDYDHEEFDEEEVEEEVGEAVEEEGSDYDALDEAADYILGDKDGKSR